MADEALKWPFIEQHPEITEAVHELEDNSLIRGRIMAFELDEAKLAARARAFAEVSRVELRDLLGAALLTKGDYSRDVGWKGETPPARELPQGRLVDRHAHDRLPSQPSGDPGSPDGAARRRLRTLCWRNANPRRSAQRDPSRWLAGREAQDPPCYDWRYYLVRYAGARSSKGDGYYNGRYDVDTGGFSYRRLRLLHGSNYAAYFSDALLRAAWVEGGLGPVAEEPSWWHRDDPGLTLKKSRIEIRCDDDAFEVVLPTDDDGLKDDVAAALSSFKTDGRGRVHVDQQSQGGRMIDSEDRIQLCIRVVRALSTASL